MTTDEDLRAVTLGEVRPHDGPVYLAPYDSRWPAQYEVLAQRIRTALGDDALRLEHVGSTSVPGLSAKPVIDILLAVTDSSAEDSYVPALEAQGFYLRIREPEWYAHRVLKARDMECNLHVFSVGCEEIARMLDFRDRLRTNPSERLAYDRAKQELAARIWRHLQNYADAKSAIVREILARQEESSK